MKYPFWRAWFLLILSLSAAIMSGTSFAATKPVLMVISNQDFWYESYAKTRSSLESMGLGVVVASQTTSVAIPQPTKPAQIVQPDIALSDVYSDDYSAIVFVGGWGASSYQYAFEGTYDNPAYLRDPVITDQVNRLIGEFTTQNKPVAAICNGVTVLAWARVDGVSPVEGRRVVGWAGGGPGFKLDNQHYADSTVPTVWHVRANGGVMPLSAAVRDPLTSADDVVVDGNIITAENTASAVVFGRVISNTIYSTQQP
jgi:putative intracellular protease/amidase